MTSVPWRHLTAASDRPNRGALYRRIQEAKGRPPMPWQQEAADLVTEYDPDTGLYRFSTVIVTVQRQAGKTELEGGVADARGMSHPGHRSRITMQDGKTADEWMREQYLETIEGTALFRGRFTSSRRAGSHGLTWWNGSTFHTFPPTRNALHSKQTDLGILDEVWVHSMATGRAIRQGLRPTMNTRPLAQTWIVSTEGTDESEFLNEYVARGRASLLDPTSRVCFIDCGIPETADVEDLDTIAAYHPAYGHTLTRRSLEDARSDFIDDATGVLDLAGWARAYGNRRTDSSQIVIPPSVWADAGAPLPAVPDHAGLALDVTPDGTRYAIGAGWEAADHVRHVEVLAAGTTDRELPRVVADLARRRRTPIAADRASIGALKVLDDAARIFPGLEVRYLTTPEYAGACADFVRGIFDRSVRHHNDAGLDAAVSVAVRRDLGDGGFGWGRKHAGGPIVELVAVTVALRALAFLPAPRRLALITAPR